MTEELSLTDIDGIGPARAETLETELGVERTVDLLDVSVADLTDATTLSEDAAQQVLDEVQAFHAVPDELEEEAVELDLDAVESTPEDDEEESEIDESLLDTHRGEHEVELETSFQVFHHVIHVVLEEATRQHQSSNASMRDSTYTLSRKLMAVLVTSGADVGDSVEANLNVDRGELNALYRALSWGAENYASRPGIPGMWGDLEGLRKVVNEVRRDAMSD